MMKAAVLSDTHLGDPESGLAYGAENRNYELLRNAIREKTGNGPLDYLILAGDILDFSIASFEEACDAARPFFLALQHDKLAKHIVYIPGNHDKHIWDAVEWEVNVIRRLKKFRNPRSFRRTQPACIDMVDGKFLLPGINEDKDTGRWGTLFLEGLFNGHKEEEIIPIYFAYPNLYIRTPSGNFLVTHGHMLELAWVLLSEMFSEVKELKEQQPMSLAHLEEFNVPLTSMICTGVGQAGEVSKVGCTIMQEAKRSETGKLREVLDTGVVRLAEILNLDWCKTFVLNRFKSAIISTVKTSAADTRYNDEFLKDPQVRKRFAAFFTASCAQACAIFTMDPPRKIIFGHTHIAHSEKEPFSIDRKTHGLPDLPVESVQLFNSGGWLKNDKKRSPLVFFLDESGALTSRSIS